ncbi:DUF4376 domain-containing protein [Shinella sp.]|uniref:DUF4376 domain-containing protein n=1 Tax=Shinella sp. TaxID=1870904 RepID=UPI00301C69B6
MRQAVIENGTVINVILAPAGFELDGETLVASDTAGIGDLYDPETAEFSSPPPPAVTAPELVAYASDLRWRIETGGAIWNGFPVHSDRESQSKIIAERLAISEGVRADPDGWKFADGEFRLLTNTEFVALSNAVRLHVRTAFATEAAVQAGIAAGDITTIAAVDGAFGVGGNE